MNNSSAESTPGTVVRIVSNDINTISSASRYNRNNGDVHSHTNNRVNDGRTILESLIHSVVNNRSVSTTNTHQLISTVVSRNTLNMPIILAPADNSENNGFVSHITISHLGTKLHFIGANALGAELLAEVNQISLTKTATDQATKDGVILKLELYLNKTECIPVHEVLKILKNIVEKATEKQKPAIKIVDGNMWNLNANQVSFKLGNQKIKFISHNSEGQNLLVQVKLIADNPKTATERMINNVKRILNEHLDSNPDDSSMMTLESILETVLASRK